MSDELFSLDDLGVATGFNEAPEDVNFYNEDAYSRLVYLLKVMKIDLPVWLKTKLPFSNDLDKPVALWSALLKSAYRKGETYGQGDLAELKQCLDNVVSAELKNFVERKKFWDYVNTLSTGLFTENEECDLADIDQGQEIEKFNSGFKPFDKVVGGFYKAVVTVAALPGAGKTSLLLSMLGDLAQSYPVWYFQTEIPSQLIKARIAQIKPKTSIPGSMVFTGNYSSEAILEKVKKNPDPNRVIIYDSPEIKTSGLEPIAYFEKVYQDLIAIKMLSRLVVTTSQTKQGISWEDLGIYSLSDSAAKARYTDIILYIGRVMDNVMIKTGKNRFGQLGSTMVKYNYATLKLEDDLLSELF